MRVDLAESTIGARIFDVDLSRDLDDAAIADILDVWWARGVLVFPGQHLDERAQLAFCSRIGEVTQLGADVYDGFAGHLHGVAELSNVDDDGNVMTGDAERIQVLMATEAWHADGDFKQVGDAGSFLNAQVVSSEGGETEFADVRAAFDALPTERQTELETLDAVHCMAADVHPDRPPVGATHVHPVVIPHPVTGAKTLYIGNHASHLLGMPFVDGRQILDELTEAACRPPRVFSHTWSVGDAVLWDNHRVLHRRRPWPMHQPRTMIRTSIRSYTQS